MKKDFIPSGIQGNKTWSEKPVRRWGRARCCNTVPHVLCLVLLCQNSEILVEVIVKIVCKSQYEKNPSLSELLWRRTCCGKCCSMVTLDLKLVTGTVQDSVTLWILSKHFHVEVNLQKSQWASPALSNCAQQPLPEVLVTCFSTPKYVSFEILY